MHGNLPALEAVIARLERDRPDAWACAGDLVGYGASPNEVIGRVSQLRAVCVAGNHDLMVLERLPDTGVPVLARRGVIYTREVLDDAGRIFLARLPLVAHVGDVMVAHGSPEDPSEYVTDVRGARGALGRATACGAQVLILGHTHRAIAFAGGDRRMAPGRGTVALPRGEPMLLNPGSVGQARERRPVARGLLVDLEARTATFHAVDYDADAARRALRAAGLPEASIHLRPTVRRALRARRQAARSVARSVARRLTEDDGR